MAKAPRCWRCGTSLKYQLQYTVWLNPVDGGKGEPQRVCKECYLEVAIEQEPPTGRVAKGGG